MKIYLNGKLTFQQIMLGCFLSILLFSQTVYSAPSNKKGGRNIKPSVSILSPQSDMTFLAGTDIKIVAHAEDSDGFIESLAFYRDAELIAYGYLNDSNEWETLWSDIPIGNYSLTALAKDSGGAESISASVQISVVEQESSPLEVEIIEPLDQTFIQEGKILRILVSIIEADGSGQTLKLFNGNKLLQVIEIFEGGEPEIYEFLWPASNPGFHAFNVKAINKKGQEFTSKPIRINVEKINKNPMVSIVSPNECITYESFNTIHFQADALDIDGDVSKIEFYVDGNLIGEDDIQPFSAMWSSLFSGTYQLVAKAIDNHGATTLSQPIQFYVEDANELPLIAITQPANNISVKKDSEILLVAEASDSDGDIEKVVFYQDSLVIETLVNEPYEFLWRAPNVAGEYLISAKAIDNKFASTTSSPVSINVLENDAPLVALTSPEGGNVYGYASPIQLIAIASDNDGSISSVAFYQGNTLLYQDYSAPYEFLWEGVEVGNYQLTAVAIDDQGALTTSDSVSIEVSHQSAVNVILDSPRDGESYSLASEVPLKASVEFYSNNVTQVEFYAGLELIGIDKTYPYELVWKPLVPGDYAISAKVISDSGVSAFSLPATISVLGEDLQLSFSSLQEGEAVPDSVVLVEGDFIAPENSGILVNGIAASIYQNRFYASVPLAAGLNLIEAVLITQSGASISKSINVHSLVPPSDIEIQVSTAQVITPFSKQLTLINHGEWSANVQINGSNTHELLAGEALKYNLSGTDAGVYRYQLTIMGEQGMLMVRDIAFVALEKSELDAMLRRNWLSMLNNLSDGDMEAALSFFSDSSKVRYERAFDLLAHKMPQIVSDLSSIQSSHLKNDYAEYAVNQINNGENHLFFVYYIKDSQGIWRIQSM